MELHQLRTFLAVAEMSSFRAAAAVQGRRQPTLSRQVRALEEEVGLDLLERRRGKGVILTRAGQVFLRSAQRVLREAETAVAEARDASTARAGDLALGFFTSLASGRLHELLRDHHERWDEVRLTIVEGNHADQVAWLHERRIDVAFIAGDVAAPTIDAQTLWEERAYAALPERHRLAGRDELVWSDLRDERFVVRSFESGSVLYNWLAGRLAPGSYLPRVSRHLAARENILGLVGAGYGLSVVSEAATGVRYPGIVFRPVAEDDAVIPITMAWLPENANPVLRRFVSFARAAQGA